MNLNENLSKNSPSEIPEKDTYGNYPDLSSVKSILVLVCKNIGDVVLASPVFSVLNNKFQDARIDVVVNSGTEEVLIENPYIKKIHLLQRSAGESSISKLKNKFKILRSIRLSKYDLAIVLTTGYTAPFLAFLSGAGKRVGVDSRKKPLFGKKKRLLNITVQHAPMNRHYVERYLDCLRKIGVFPEKNLKKTIFSPGEYAELRVKKLFNSTKITPNKNYIVIHPTSRWMFKCWENKKIAELIDLIQEKLKIPVILTSGPDRKEKSYLRNVLFHTKTNVIDFTGILSLRELGALLQDARLFIGIDSAPMHISCAVNTPVVALFGPTSELDWGPWGEGHKIIFSDNFPCRPCNRDGCGGSKKSECLEEIDVKTVFSAVKEILHAG